jgi:hypothetical protein
VDSGTRYRFGQWALVSLVVLNLGSLGFLWFEYSHRPRPPQRDSGESDAEGFLARDVGLNEEQARIVQILREEHFRETDSIRLEIHDLSRQMMEELFAPSPDTAKARELSAMIGDKHAEFELDVFEHFHKVKQICSPDQQRRLKRLVLEILNKSKKPPPRHAGPDGDRRQGPDDRRPPLDDHRPLPGDDDRLGSPDTGRPGM